MDRIISIKELSYTYGTGKKSFQALDKLDLEVNSGEIFGFIGPNGAGKTTTIKLLLGIFQPSFGDVSIFGMNPSDLKARYSVGYMPEIADYYRFLTPVELLKMYGDIFHIKKKILSERIDYLIELVGLKKHANKLMGTFSKGMMQKISFAQALINDPDLLILDEPTSGLDPIARMKMREVLLFLREEGKTVFFSSHELSEVELICDGIGILNKGKLLAAGARENLIREKGTGQSLESYFLELIRGDE